MTSHLRDLFRQVHQALDAAESAALVRAAIDITVQQATVLKAIAERSKPSQTDIVEATGIDRSTMADICQRLSNKGLITRNRAKDDHRKRVLELTHKGREIRLRSATISTHMENRLDVWTRGNSKKLEGTLKQVLEVTRDSVMTAEAAE